LQSKSYAQLSRWNGRQPWSHRLQTTATTNNEDQCHALETTCNHRAAATKGRAREDNTLTATSTNKVGPVATSTNSKGAATRRHGQAREMRVIQRSRRSLIPYLQKTIESQSRQFARQATSQCMTCQVLPNIATAPVVPPSAGTTSSRDVDGPNAPSNKLAATSHERTSWMASSMLCVTNWEME
jgi:hypothetical protein